MKKIIIILCIMAILCLGILWTIKKSVMPILTGTLNTFVKQIDTPYLTVRFDKAEDTCFLRPCLQIQNLYIRLLDKEFNGGTITVEVPYKWPLGIQIQSVPSDTPSDIRIDADLSDDTLNVHNLNIKSGDFLADLKGSLNTQTLHFTADMNAQNLARFITPYIPQNMQFFSSLFLSDNMQNLKLTDKDGWLTIGDFPLFPLDTNTLSEFLNTNTNGGNFNTFTPPPSDLNLNNLGTLFRNILQ